MRKNSVTVEYPPLLKWLRTLSQWVELARASTPKEACRRLWNNDRFNILEWIENGHCMMVMGQCDTSVAEDIMRWIAKGIIDPKIVSMQLEYQNWEYVIKDDYDDNSETEYFALKDSWDAALGFSMILHCTELPVCDKNKDWLAQGVELFYIPDPTGADHPYSTSVNIRHEAWLRDLCLRAPWAREVVAQWMLDNPQNSPRWPWCFHEDLGTSPTLDFLENILFAIDGDNGASSDDKNIQLALLKTQAPEFYMALNNGQHLYSLLYGSMPQDYIKHEHYCNDRADTIRSMLVQTTAHQAEKLDVEARSSTSPSMGRLFGEDAPSNAV